MYMHELPFLVVVIYMQAVQNAAFPLQTCPALPLAVCVCVCVCVWLWLLLPAGTCARCPSGTPSSHST
jgi:hypothetical protein